MANTALRWWLRAVSLSDPNLPCWVLQRSSRETSDASVVWLAAIPRVILRRGPRGFNNLELRFAHQERHTRYRFLLVISRWRAHGNRSTRWALHLADSDGLSESHEPNELTGPMLKSTVVVRLGRRSQSWDAGLGCGSNCARRTKA